MRKGTILPIALMAFAIVAFLLLVDLAISPKKSTNSNANLVACTQEAKLCPDGSYVGRTGPSCAFAECPGTNANVMINTNTTVDVTKDWKTYSNPEHSFQMKYPKEWLVEEILDQSLSGRIEKYDFIQFYIKANPTNPSDTNRVNKITISIFPRQEAETAESTYQRLVPTDLSGLPKQTLTIGGQEAIMYSGFPGFTSSDGIFFAHATSSFLLKSYVGADERTLVLNSFTFTNPTAGWKTYTNKDIRFSFKYPKEYGDAVVTISEGDTGKKFSGSFTGNKAITFGGVSKDFTIGRSSGITSNDTIGWEHDNGPYFYLWSGGATTGRQEITPFKTVQAVNTEGPMWLGTGEGIGGANMPKGEMATVFYLYAIKGTTFPAISFLGGHDATISQTDFEKVVSTYTFLK